MTVLLYSSECRAISAVKPWMLLAKIEADVWRDVLQTNRQRTRITPVAKIESQTIVGAACCARCLV